MKEVSRCKHFFAWLFLGKFLPLNDELILRCSRCKSKMKKIKKGDITIDVCNNCGGMFLDDGEIDKLAKLGKQKSFKNKKGKNA